MTDRNRISDDRNKKGEKKANKNLLWDFEITKKTNYILGEKQRTEKSTITAETSSPHLHSIAWKIFVLLPYILLLLLQLRIPLVRKLLRNDSALSI